MKILQQGNKPVITNMFDFYCTLCFCVWEADRAEVHDIDKDYIDIIYGHMDCPNCGNRSVRGDLRDNNGYGFKKT